MINLIGRGFSQGSEAAAKNNIREPLPNYVGAGKHRKTACPDIFGGDTEYGILLNHPPLAE